MIIPNMLFRNSVIPMILKKRKREKERNCFQVKLNCGKREETKKGIVVENGEYLHIVIELNIPCLSCQNETENFLYSRSLNSYV
jgi:hypothetical protein